VAGSRYGLQAVYRWASSVWRA